jgi:hypothetical protein
MTHNGLLYCWICGKYKPPSEMGDVACKACEGQRPKDHDWRTAWCPRCKKETKQQYWSNRGWVCHDDGKGCAMTVVSEEEYAESMGQTEGITKEDIWGK